ncbi:hypothetical protein PCANC_02158 [Puccinia coronata f. sp. avenae]|uniref:Uncharacterized protein n=1 Tax=Puccinia coronata f. sp. avenae TaxID=200324 RepID=A0A2N5VZS4_9BASI|nr:hypothetical protein PCANC_02158 [Puccinia coronata f. sp. avenae]
MVATSSCQASPLETDDLEKQNQQQDLGENMTQLKIRELLEDLPEESSLSELELDEKRKTYYNFVIQSAFQPRNTDRKEEIFDGIIKPSMENLGDFGTPFENL